MFADYFYKGMTLRMKWLVETMSNGEFLTTSSKEAMDFLSYAADSTIGREKPYVRDMGRAKPQSGPRGSAYNVHEDFEMKAKAAHMSRRIEDLENRESIKYMLLIE